MRYYPIFVDLDGRACLVVGAGEVGARKVAGLADSGPAEVLVVDPAEPGPDFAPLLGRPNVRFERRGFEESDLDGRFLVIASTGVEALNRRISELCRGRGILCNIVDQPDKCSFIVPATVRRGDLTLAVSTGGASPAMAKKIRKDLETFFGGEYALFLALMARLRPLVLSLGWSTKENSDLFRGVVASPLMERLATGDAAAVQAALADVLPPELKPRIPELVHGLI